MKLSIVTTFAELRRSLTAWAQTRPGMTIVPIEQAAAGDVVLTTMTDCSPLECQYFATKGRRLVILAALPSERSRSLYLAAGAAAYIPMDGGAGELEAALRIALADPPAAEPSSLV